MFSNWLAAQREIAVQNPADAGKKRRILQARAQTEPNAASISRRTLIVKAFAS
jgi:hypothetical protein